MIQQLRIVGGEQERGPMRVRDRGGEQVHDGEYELLVDAVLQFVHNQIATRAQCLQCSADQWAASQGTG